MLGPLPTLYRVVVALCALGVFIGVGAWLTFTLPGPFLAPAGAGIGAGIGVVAVLLLLRGQGHGQGPHGARIRSRH